MINEDLQTLHELLDLCTLHVFRLPLAYNVRIEVNLDSVKTVQSVEGPPVKRAKCTIQTNHVKRVNTIHI